MKTFKQYWDSLSTKKKEKLIEDSGISKSYLSQIANGRVKNPTIATMNKLKMADRKIKYDMFVSLEAK